MPADVLALDHPAAGWQTSPRRPTLLTMPSPNRSTFDHFGYPVQAAALGVINTVWQLVHAVGWTPPPDLDAAITAMINSVWVFAMAVIATYRNGGPLALADESEHQ